MAYTETARQFFDRIGSSVAALSGLEGALAFEIDGEGGGTWIVDLADGHVESVTSRAPGAVQAVVKAGERDFMALVEGRMSPQDGLLTERLRVAGDMAKLTRVLAAFETLREDSTKH